jgi:hypothetical protein
MRTTTARCARQTRRAPTWHCLQSVVGCRVRLEDVQQVLAVLCEPCDASWWEAAVHVSAERLHQLGRSVGCDGLEPFVFRLPALRITYTHSGALLTHSRAIWAIGCVVRRRHAGVISTQDTCLHVAFVECRPQLCALAEVPAHHMMRQHDRR